MKNILLTLILLAFIPQLTSGQATIVVKNPAWELEDQAENELRTVQWAESQAQLASTLSVQKERLSMIKEATEKLKQINNLVASYSYFVNSLELTNKCLTTFSEKTKEYEANNLLSASEIKSFMNSLQTILDAFATNITTIQNLVTASKMEMNDGDRMSNLRETIQLLKKDIATFYALVDEIDTLQNQRAALNTIKYLKSALQ